MITLQSTDTQLQQLAQAEDRARGTTVRVDCAALRALLRDHYTLCTARGIRFKPQADQESLR